MKLTKQQRTIVKKARERIADPSHWCQGSYARMADGRRCAPDDLCAQKFCAIGALAVELSAAHGLSRAMTEARKLGNLLADGRELANINDSAGHTAVLALFDEALA